MISGVRESAGEFSGGSAKSRNRSFCVLRKTKTGNFSVVTLRVATLKIPGLVFFVIHQKFSTGTFVCYAPMILQVSLCENGSFKTRRSKGKNLQSHHIGIMVAGLILTASQKKSRRNQHDGLLIKKIVAKKVRSSATMLCIRPYIIRGFQPGFHKTGQCKHLCQYIITGKGNKQ